MQKPVARPAAVTNRRQSSPFGFGYLLTFVIFILSVAVSGGVYFYKAYTDKQLQSLISEIEAKKDSDPALTATLKRLDNRIESAKVLLANHMAVSGIFSMLERATLMPVQLTALTVGIPEGTTEGVSIKVEGRAVDLDAIALQYETMRDEEGIRQLVVSEVDNDEPGEVTFVLTGGTDKSLVSFEEALARLKDTSSDSPTELPVVNTLPKESASSTQ